MAEQAKRRRGVLFKVVLGILCLGAVLGVLKGVQEYGDTLEMIEPTGPETVEGNLTRSPILFTQNDFYIYPSRVEAEGGRLRVPAFHNGESSDWLEIRYVRFPAIGETTRPPIVYLAGGPGGSGISSAAGDRFPFFMKLREAGEVIVVDQRGTVLTDPHPVCEAENGLPLDLQADDPALDELREAFFGECWAKAQGQIPPAAFTTVESARDLDALREALGISQWSLVGLSYGTHLGQAYMKAFPQRVASAVLIGVEGLDQTYKSPKLVDTVFARIDTALREQAGWPSLMEDYASAIDYLSENRPTVEIEDREGGQHTIALGPLDLKTAIFFGMSERGNFLSVAERVRTIAEGDYELLGHFAMRYRSRSRLAVMPVSMDCASGLTEARREQIASELDGALIGEVANIDLDRSCPYWPVDDLGDEFREAVRADIPLLAVSGTLDTRTPPENVTEALANYGSYSHLIIEGAGHGDDLLISSPEIAERLAEFFRTGQAEDARITLPDLTG